MKKVLLIGDQCKDVYHYGTCSRISPEAPVVIMDEIRSETRPGMALNVYHNLLSLGLKVEKIISEKKLIKHRYIESKHNKHLLRVDEVGGPSDFVFDKSALEGHREVSGVVISDYNKGFLKAKDLQDICNYYNKLQIPVFIDTKKRDLSKISNAIIKINKKEFQAITYMPLKSKIIITLGADGAEFEGDVFPVEKVNMFDPCGAGDVFLAALVRGYLNTEDFSKAIGFANKLASFSTTKMGTYIVKEEDLNGLCF